MGYDWNEEQKAIIGARGHDMLVSASAGSGKTTVMLERVKRLITDERVPVKRIVMVSYNESIAEELKTKLYAALESELSSGLNGPESRAFIERQLNDLESANITTIDGYANRLVREFFDKSGLDPSAEVGDKKDNENRLMKSVLAVVRRAKDSGDTEFFLLKNKLGGDKNLIKAVLLAYRYACVRPNPEEWLTNTARVYGMNLDDTGLVGEFQEKFRAFYGDTAEKLEESLLLSGVPREKAVTPYLLLDIYKAIAKAENYDEVYLAVSADIPKQSYTKAIFGDFKAEISVYSKTLADSVKRAREIFYCDSRRANAIHRACAADARKLGALALETFNEYRKTKDADCVIDFTDMTYFAARLLRDDDTAAEIRERYDYVFVDEYQDENYIADFILNRISRDNLFAVGDVKQSIYGFRLAEPAIMLERSARFTREDEAENRPLIDRKAIRLRENYRSDPRILTAVNGVFGAVMTEKISGIDYERHEKFLPKAVFQDNGVEPFKCVFFVQADGETPDSDSGADAETENGEAVPEIFDPNKRRKKKKFGIDYAEGEYIADKIAELMEHGIYDKDLGGLRPLEFSDICLLSRDRQRVGNAVDNAVNVLLSRGYPVDCSGIRKNKETDEVNIIIEMLRVIDNSTEEIPLAAALLSVWGGMTSEELYKIRAAARSMSFYDAVLAARPKNAKVDKFFRLVDKCREMLGHRRLSDVVAMLVYDCGYESELRRDKAKLQCVREFIFSLEGYAGTLSDYLITAGGGADYDSVSDFSDGKCIRTCTIHKSKGLEYPVVFMVGADANFRLDKDAVIAYKDYGIGVNSFDEDALIKTPSFAAEVMNLIRREEQRNEEMRLLYVAMTRAKNHLFVTGTLPKKSKDAAAYVLPHEVTRFKDWLSNAAALGKLDKSLLEVRPALPRECGRYSEIILPRDITYAKSAIDDYIGAPYAYLKSTRLGLKHTVTELVAQGVYEDAFTYRAASEADDGAFTDKARRGTDYHTILEHIDYNAVTPDAVNAEIDRMIERGLLAPEQREFIVAEEIADVMQSPIIREARETPHMREQEFMLSVKASEYFDCDGDDEIIVQGAIDLLIVGETLTLVDFKKSKKGADYLKQRYSAQLNLYARAAVEALGKPVGRKFLYVIGTNEIINIE